MTNDLVAELKALLKEGSGYNQTMTIEPLEDGEWCSITTSSIDVCGDNVVIYARRMDGMNNCPDGMIELSDFGVTDFNIDDEYKYIIEVECKIWHLIYGLGKRTDIHTAVAARPKDFCYAFAQIDWATTSINNIAAYLLEEEDSNERDE
ncbi:hypothetical protein PND20_02465 [Ligilactobacillus ruminis]|uniref:hypothetical protein n=1 Tax=Ligilactobacillus ruminis TaxID=1623 RepID=UPI00232CB177|nr:hypothetical protein [Ligilactobacillus ruminis]MDB7641082.1 hypothetical protein [Ligilactobacillus ruminis]MDB7646266.1 hypothetical protein [Ligilactobacillus ruminis]MDB7648215.1 hypothetical protein [Ligilactobacillus ruminis]